MLDVINFILMVNIATSLFVIDAIFGKNIVFSV